MPRFDDQDEEELWDEESDEDEEEPEPDDGEELDSIIGEGEHFAETGQYRKALRLWRRNIDRFSDEPLAFHHLALAAFHVLEEAAATQDIWQSDSDLLGLHEEAVTALEEALSMDKDRTDSLNLLGALHALRENYKEAIASWERSLKINPNQRQVKADLKDAKKNLGSDE